MVELELFEVYENVNLSGVLEFFLIHENKLLSWHRGKPWLSLVEVHLDFGVQYFLSKAGGAKSSQKFQFCLCVSVYPCNQLQDLQTFVAYTNWLFIFCKKSICKPKMFSLEKVRFLWVLHVLQLWTMRGGDDGLWLFMRIWNAIECLFVRCSCTQRSRSCWKKDQWMEVDDLWEAMKMWLLLRNFKLYVL